MRVHFFSHRPSVPPDHGVPFERVLGGLTGGNTGNQLFFSALERQVQSSSVSFGYRFNADEINAEAGLVVIPAANWLARGNDFSAWRDILAPVKVPIVMAGLGAQASLDATIPEVSEGTLSFLRLVAERTEAIGTRGYFTSEALAHYGIHNTRTVGCPTLYYHCRPDFPTVQPPRGLTPSQVVIQATRHEARPDSLRRPGPSSIQRRLLAVAQSSSFHYILQSEKEEILFKLAGRLPEESEARLLAYYQVGSLSELAPFLARMRVFLNVDDWMTFLATMAFVCGSRIHGVIASLLAGTPATLFAHDSRTAEMAAFAGLPVYDQEEFLREAERNGPTAAVNRVAEAWSLASFLSRYPENYSAYRQFMEDNRVPHRLG